MDHLVIVEGLCIISTFNFILTWTKLLLRAFALLLTISTFNFILTRTELLLRVFALVVHLISY